MHIGAHDHNVVQSMVLDELGERPDLPEGIALRQTDDLRADPTRLSPQENVTFHRI
jgi:hypothetical protein